MISKQSKKIILTGGGTGGSVSPLLALVEELKNYPGNFSFLWIGTKKGPEKQMVKKEKIKFLAISSGKYRRYLSWRNFIDPFKIIIGFFQSLSILLVWRPKIILNAGGFVGVPVAWAAWILRIPILIHQQDIRPGLANKLMAPVAKIITVTFKKSLKDYGKKAIWTGNPVRKKLRSCKINEADKLFFKLKPKIPVVLIVGGGTGSEAMNILLRKSLNTLTKFCQIIHVTGKGAQVENLSKKEENYYPFDFLDVDKMVTALKLADVVVSRAGLGLLTELSYLGKASLIIPMPDSHQEENAKIFDEYKATVVLNQKKINSREFISQIKKIISNKEIKDKLSKNIKKIIKKDAEKNIANIVNKITE